MTSATVRTLTDEVISARVCVVDASVRTPPSRLRVGPVCQQRMSLSASPNRPFDRLRLPWSVSLSCRGTFRTEDTLNFQIRPPGVP